MIVLGSHDAAIDLLEKRSANYSDRVPSPLVDMYVCTYHVHQRVVHNADGLLPSWLQIAQNLNGP